MIEPQEKDKTLVNMIGNMAASKEIREKEEAEKEAALLNNDETPSNVYLAPGKRPGFAMDSENLECTIRVSNLPKDVRDVDIRDLFERFGRLGRVSVPQKETNEKGVKENKGSAFVEFKYRDDAEKAMERLQSHTYGHMILKLEWAKPSLKTNVGGMSGLEGRTSGYGEKLAQDTSDKGVIYTSTR
jgi:RNA recognition motif-containing protein